MMRSLLFPAVHSLRRRLGETIAWVRSAGCTSPNSANMHPGETGARGVVPSPRRPGPAMAHPEDALQQPATL